jgi:redox-sensitive bicupin YhaK (pirin superfamily)
MGDGATFEHELEAGTNAFLLVLEGSAIVGRQERPVASGELAWLTRSDEAPSLVTIKASGVTAFGAKQSSRYRIGPTDP